MTQLAKYEPRAIQERWARFWDEQGYFHSQPSPGRPRYSIVIPPPNVTGALHLGHALNGALQDIMVRFKRMQGHEALWVPGADHAGIATQAVVERRLFEEEKKTRHDVGRAELVRRIWAWKDEYEARIIKQLKAMGASCDWQRWRFTLDLVCARAVRETFFRMFRDGLIYRGKRLVNWDVQLQTAVADDEVYHDEVEGHLWHFLYPVEDSDEKVEIATTRPETMLGDTAVAVHPEDPRYRHLVGRRVRLPLMDRPIPIIADGQLVDPAFGTGVVKVTPAHDPNDYACGHRHGLPMINVLTPDGRINANGGRYQGLTREAARKAVVADLQALGLVASVEPHPHDLPHSDRSKTPIEPYLSEQWFVRMADLAENAMAAVREGHVRIHPARYANTYLDWLGEKRDWCISRQLWWGHQIPVWSKEFGDEPSRQAGLQVLERLVGQHSQSMAFVVEEYDPSDAARPALGALHVSLREDNPPLVGQIEAEGFVRDPDVLDTWFSSALWPHSTMGWPEPTPELDYYYPTNLLITAREIITLWVARMVLTSQYNLGQVPFRDVYIHPVIQDGQGRPMKKSLGNGVDPFDIIDKYGADALRYTLAAMTTETQDVRMPVKRERLADGREVNVSEKFEIGRNFGTKIYNAARFILMNLAGHTPGPLDTDRLATADRWILDRLSRTTRAVTAGLDSFQFSEVGKLLYDFVWGDLCDWYIEITKPRFQDPVERDQVQRISALVLDWTLRLLHPVMPFLTEELWQALGQVASHRDGTQPAAPAVTIAPWPQPCPEWEDETIGRRMALLQDVVRAVRNIRAEFGIEPRAEVDVVVDCDGQWAEFLRGEGDSLRLLARIRNLYLAHGAARPRGSAAHVLPECQVYVCLADLVDFEAEIQKQTKKKAELEKRRESVANKLASPSFVSKAPPEIVDQQRELLRQLDEQIAGLARIIEQLQQR